MSQPRSAARPKARPAPRPQPAQTRFIIARGDKLQAFHIRPRMIMAAGLCLALFSVLYFGATAYLVFRDDIIGVSSGHQEQMRERYEDRISALRNEIERITSRRLVDHATVEQKVERLLDQQEALGARQEMLSRLTDAARRAGFDLPAPKPAPAPSADGPQANADPVAQPSVVLASVAPGANATDRGSAEAAKDLDAVARQLNSMEDDQQAVVDGMVGTVAGRVDKIAAVLKRLGRKVPPPPAGEDDVGGPFVPLPPGYEDEAFQAGVQSLSDQLDRLAAVRNIALSLPLSRPIADAEITSPFGPRVDPFLGRPAMHTGIDFRAPDGYPVRSVAAGTIVAAEYNGGYGNMVDVDHGNGIVTRYGHMSSISVRVGEKVAAGGKLGRVGATGRATGPHLHYEIRVGGQAINPMRYLSAGEQIAALL